MEEKNNYIKINKPIPEDLKEAIEKKQQKSMDFKKLSKSSKKVDVSKRFI